MKYTVEGFNQALLVEMGLDCIDACILRWIIDFYNTGKMNKIFINNKEYFWVHYQTLIDEMPILNIKNRQSLARRLQKFVDCNLFEKYIDQKAGNRTYFAINQELYESLVSTENNNGYQLKSQEVLTQKSRGIDSKVETSKLKSQDIDYSTNSSTNINQLNKNIYMQLFDNFWKLYPKRNGKKVGKKECLNWWKKKVKSEELALKIIKGVENFAESSKALKGFAEDPIRFLKHERYEDWQEPEEEECTQTLEYFN